MTATDLPEYLTAYTVARDAQRAEAAAKFLEKLTPREQRLVREAAVMGWVQGLQRNRGDADAVLADSAMLAVVVDAMLANADLYPITSHVAAQPRPVVVEMTREDAQELQLILTGDRYHMDKGDDRPVPQPRWGANVRISEAVAAALAAPNPEDECPRCTPDAHCGHDFDSADDTDPVAMPLRRPDGRYALTDDLDGLL